MTIDEIIQHIVDVHNVIVDIPVKGDDAIAMATAIQRLRNLVMELSNDEENRGASE